MREKQRKTCVSSQRPELLIFSENSILRYVFVQKQAISKSISLKHENTSFRRMTLWYVCMCGVVIVYKTTWKLFGAHKVVCLYIIRYTHEKVFLLFRFRFYTRAICALFYKKNSDSRVSFFILTQEPCSISLYTRYKKTVD